MTIPEGYTDQHDSDIWNIGYVFQWSNVYECWMNCEIRLTIKPNASVDIAFEDRMEYPMSSDYTVFFILVS